MAMKSRRQSALKTHFSGGRNEHEVLENAVLVQLSKRGDVRVWKNETGALPVYRKNADGSVMLDSCGEPLVERYLHYGLLGSPDLIGVLTIRLGEWSIGIWLGVEIKTGSGRLTRDQQLFRAMMESMGGIYIEGRSIEQVVMEVEAYIKAVTEGLKK